MLAQRPKKALTLPEELEKIEQQITLTLQEIDHNFNKAHRIVTSSIIPVVERFGNESKTVWEGSKVLGLAILHLVTSL
ncbi:DASH complex subunit Ask1-domain-containing protein [Terfezia claveryi]|nr:DASH complex subunit Ask1-domain-containing protein [Terfezia claveryi]